MIFEGFFHSFLRLFGLSCLEFSQARYLVAELFFSFSRGFLVLAFGAMKKSYLEPK